MHGWGRLTSVLLVLVFTVTACAPQAASPQASREPIKVGLLLPQSGVFQSLGEDLTAGFDLYLDEIGGQVDGRKIQVIREDEGATPQEGLVKVRKLIDNDKVDILAGFVNAAIAYGARDFIHESKTPTVVMVASGQDLTRKLRSPYMFRTSHTTWQLAHPLGIWMADNVAKSAVTSASDFAAGKEYVAGFIEGFSSKGGKITSQLWPKLGTSDFAPFLTEMKGANPQATFNFYAGSDAVRFVQQYRQFGLGSVPISGIGLFDDQLLPAEGDAALGGRSAWTWAIDLKTDENRKFIDAYQKKTKKLPTDFVPLGYDAARTIVDAVKAAKTDTTKDGLVKALEATDFEGPRGRIRFDKASHNIIPTIYIREVKRGQAGLQNLVVGSFPNVIDPADR